MYKNNNNECLEFEAPPPPPHTHTTYLKIITFHLLFYLENGDNNEDFLEGSVGLYVYNVVYIYTFFFYF